MTDTGMVRVFYIGLHPGSLTFINKDPFEVVGVSYLDFLGKVSINPINSLFSLVYTVHKSKLPHAVTIVLFSLWQSMHWLTTGYRSRYKDYLKEVVLRKVDIVDAEQHASIADFISENKIDLLLINGWSLLPKELVVLPRLGCINVHPSILPKYRGALPTLWALKNNDTESAVSLILLTAGVDTGPMISQRNFKIDFDDNAISVEGKIDQVLEQHLWSDIHEYVTGHGQQIEQVGEVSTTSKYATYRQVQWLEETAKDIVNKVLLYPFFEPGLYVQSTLGRRVIRIKNASEAPTDVDVKPGVYKIMLYTVLIKAKEGTVLLRLFRDVGVMDSLILLFTKQRTVGEHSC